MATDLVRAEPVFRQWMEIGDRILRQTQGFSPLEAIYSRDKAKTEPFDRLEHSHPALFMTQFAAAKLCQAKGLRPDLLIGVSLGEFVAMSVAGMIPFETALKAVAAQPAIFGAAAPAGALIAALAPEELVIGSSVLRETTEVAGISGPSHAVLACLARDEAAVISELRRLDVPFQKLPVPHPFHASFIEAAREGYVAAAEKLAFQSPFWPVWSSCLGRPIDTVDADFLWQIVRAPMRLRDTLAAIKATGGARFIDLSPTGTLAAILRASPSDTMPVSPLMSPFGGDLERLEGLTASVVAGQM